MSTSRRYRCDDETGEIITYEVNDETGEPRLMNSQSVMEKTHSPNSTLFPIGPFNRSKQFQELKANILAGSNTTSPRLLLIITTLVFSKLCCVLLFMLEVYLHLRCHEKNKLLKDPNLYYRSPFHVLTCVFCGACREQNVATKVSQMQDKRHWRYDYLRGLAI
ncbi:uncharacterized protein LOC121738394 [Aricia agestis]|uniref:uncharacterized protein LOC121738394 n=1 Tax=Aricia agestis TaxID=91739 RepID=UPI001C20AA3A|nr:uncharacterized protein LOC121738394 [Aricia agestis]XP_041986345.1 uncharacterized protein LOC121738394 [Aricia agestis]XP_041986346.1 uncharacterized protein LOC121738394 [Aricia agestis]